MPELAEGSWSVFFWAGFVVVGHPLVCANLLTAHALGADIPLLTHGLERTSKHTHAHVQKHTHIYKA